MYEQGKPRPYAESKPLVVEDVELSGPSAGEVLVKIAAAGLCHSDLSAIAGLRARTVPTVVGHEAAGVVQEVGPGVDHVRKGDHVVVFFVSSCGHCEFCDSGRANLCESSWDARAQGKLETGSRHLSRAADNDPLNHYSGVSAFAEFAVVSQNSIVKIDPDVPLDVAAIFGCAVITGVGAVVNTARVQVGSAVAVTGLGGVGLSAILGAKAAGAETIIAVDVNEKKLEHAKKLGATATFKADDDAVGKIRELTQGGVHYSFEMAGVPAATETAYRITRRGGTLVTAGLPEPTLSFPLPLAHCASNEITVAGSYMGSSVPKRDIPRFIKMFKNGHLAVDLIKSRSIGLDEINEGFDALARGDTVRDVLVFPG